MATAEETLLTAEEYARLPDDGRPTELVRGRVFVVNVPTPRHGQICAKVARLVGNNADEQNLGQVTSNDSGVVTERNPDTVRGADVAFYSFARVPRGPFPRGYLPSPPELVFEVRSPTDRWSEILAKVTEYLGAGVTAVCVLDEVPRTLTVYRDDRPPEPMGPDADFSLPDILGDFRVRVGRFFE
jgi:Uma2 family endonuclease